MDTNSNNNTAVAAGNNHRKYKRSSNSNPKSKKQLENELNRQRSFFVAGTQNHSPTAMLHNNNNTQGGYFNRSNSTNAMGGQKKHPTLAIYRPPSVRGDINNNSDNVYVANGLQKSKNFKDSSDMNKEENCISLNVHAKEFSIERSKTAPQSIMNGAKPESIQHNRGPMISRSRTFFSNGDIKPVNQKKSCEYKGYKNNFQQIKYTQQKDVQGPKVQFNEPKRKSKTIPNDDANKQMMDSKNDFSLRRSKSYNDSKYSYHQNTSEETSWCKYQTNEFSPKDLNCFPEDINDMAKRIVKDTKNSPTKDLMLLALKIIEHAVSQQDALNPSVNLSLYIIEMKQNKVLLTRMEKDAYSRKQTLLMLLFKICEHCLTPSKEKNTTEEIECLFNIVNDVGRDLEQEVPDTFKQLFVSIRDVILTRDCTSSVRKFLLHLIELRASKWALPSSTINYYNSKTNV